MPIDPHDYESRLLVRNLTLDDYDALVALQSRCFPGMAGWSKEQIAAQIETFPKGQFGLWLDDDLVASCSSLVVDEADHADWHDWHSIAAGGMITTHDDDGDTLYGIEIQVDPECRGMRLARRLYDARKHLAASSVWHGWSWAGGSPDTAPTPPR